MIFSLNKVTHQYCFSYEAKDIGKEVVAKGYREAVVCVSTDHWALSCSRYSGYQEILGTSGTTWSRKM